MNQLDSELRAVFGDIVSRTPELGPAPDADTQFSLLSTTPSRRRSSQNRSLWALPAAAALAMIAIGGVFLIRQRNNASTPAVATQTTAASTAPTSTIATPATTLPPTTSAPAPTTPSTVVETPVGTDQPVVSTPEATQPPQVVTKAVLAFDNGGQASQVPVGQAAAVPLFTFDNLNDFWEMFDLSASRDVAFIGTCCEPADGAVFQVNGATSGSPSLVDVPETGYGVSISPNEQFVAYGSFVDNPVSIRNLASGEWVTSPSAPGWDSATMSFGSYTPKDIIWLDDQRLLTLGSRLGSNGPEDVLYEVVIDGSGQIVSVSEPASTQQASDVDRPFQFAGQPDATHVAIHQLGAPDVLLFDLASRTQTGTQTVGDRGYKSAWYDQGGHLTTVDENGELRVDGTVIPGTFSWARTT